MSNPLIQK